MSNVMSSLNWIDYFFLALFFLSILVGFARGLIRELISLVFFVVALIIASWFAGPLAEFFTNLDSVQSVVTQGGDNAAKSVSYLALSFSFGLIFIGVLIVGAIIGFILGLALQTSILGFGNRLLGALFGLCRGLIFSLVIIFVVQLTTMGEQEVWKKSQIVAAFQEPVQGLGDLVSPTLSDLKEKFGKTMEDVHSNIKENVRTTH